MPSLNSKGYVPSGPSQHNMGIHNRNSTRKTAPMATLISPRTPPKRPLTPPLNSSITNINRPNTPPKRPITPPKISKSISNPNRPITPPKNSTNIPNISNKQKYIRPLTPPKNDRSSITSSIISVETPPRPQAKKSKKKSEMSNLDSTNPYYHLSTSPSSPWKRRIEGPPNFNVRGFGGQKQNQSESQLYQSQISNGSSNSTVTTQSTINSNGNNTGSTVTVNTSQTQQPDSDTHNQLIRQDISPETISNNSQSFQEQEVNGAELGDFANHHNITDNRFDYDHLYDNRICEPHVSFGQQFQGQGGDSTSVTNMTTNSTNTFSNTNKPGPPLKLKSSIKLSSTSKKSSRVSFGCDEIIETSPIQIVKTGSFRKRMLQASFGNQLQYLIHKSRIAQISRKYLKKDPSNNNKSKKYQLQQQQEFDFEISESDSESNDEDESGTETQSQTQSTTVNTNSIDSGSESSQKFVVKISEADARMQRKLQRIVEKHCVVGQTQNLNQTRVGLNSTSKNRMMKNNETCGCAIM